MKEFVSDDNTPGPRPRVVMENFPVDPDFFRKDLKPYVEPIIQAHGKEEWNAAVLTNEIHRHLGIYSIIGVKMGILAREMMEAGLDDLNVEANTGSRPPVSCIVDGLQVATGASLGRGSITVINTGINRPEATFIKDHNCLKLSLKGDYIKMINSAINEISEEYRSDPSMYFKEIRKISIVYWLELSRYDIFGAIEYMKSIKKVN